MDCKCTKMKNLPREGSCCDDAGKWEKKGKNRMYEKQKFENQIK